MNRLFRLTSVSSFLLYLFAALVSSGCGSTTTSTTGIAQVSVTVSPTTIAAQASTNTQYQYEADFTVNLSETSSSVAATVNQISATVAEIVGGIAVDTGNVLSEIQVNSTSNRLNAGGTLAVPCQVFYTLPGGGTASQITVAISILDDNGNQVGGNVIVDVS